MLDRGTILAGSAQCGWALDGGALHLYGFEGETSATEALLVQAEEIARRFSAAVCVATLDEDDRWVEPLSVCGFERDDAEPTVRNGEVRIELTLLRIVQG